MLSRVLIVEDDVELTRVLQQALAENGHTVASAGNVDAAFGECMTRNPDVILLDLHLREPMDGAEFLRVYRERGGKAKVIAVSGVTDAATLVKDLEVDEFIGKPFDFEHLLSSVRRFAEE